MLINPTPGRVVWYHAAAHEREMSNYSDVPLAAHIAFVFNERLVNLMVIDFEGNPRGRNSVPLLQEGDPKPSDAYCYCEWMPYQRGQAEKTAQLEKQLAAG